jgi:16S rRNA (uracil1498-N3)-methyltransferase
MRIPRFFVTSESIDLLNQQANLSEQTLINQISNVLRLREGDLIDVLDNQGQIYRCRLKTKPVGKKNAESSWFATIESSARATGEPARPLEIALPMLRPNRYEWALEKLTELGATSIVPLLVQHSVTRDGKLSRWQNIVKEAAEQCERAFVPDICPPIPIEAYLKRLTIDEPDSTIFICAERAEAMTLPAVLCNQNLLAPHKISVIVGAEGGFTAEELKLAEELGVVPVTLGSRILRAETAAIYALSLIVSYLEQTNKQIGTS